MVLARAATKTGPSCSEFPRAVFPAGGAVGAGLGSHVRSPAQRISIETAVCWPGKLRKPASPAKVLLRNGPQSGITPYRYPRQGPHRTVTILCRAPCSRSNPPSRSPFGKPSPPVSFAHKKHIIFILRFRSKILSSYYSHIAVLFCDDCRKEAASEPDKMEGLLMEILVRRAKWVALRRGSQICCHIESLLTAY